MKRLIILTLGALAVFACAKQEEPQIEVSYPAPEAVTVDDGHSSASSITVIFDGSAATNAGAASFTVALVPENGDEIVSNKNVGIQNAWQHEFRNLAKGKYSVYACANYADNKVSDKIYAKDSKGNVSVLVLDGSLLAVKLAYSTSSTLAFTWSPSGFEDALKDCAVPYSFGIYNDAACKELIVSWKTDKDDSIWDTDLAEGFPQFEFSGLKANTSYWFKVTDMDAGYTCDPVEARTAEFTVVEPSKTGQVAEGGIALAEDFSELVWGGNYLKGSAAYSADDRNLADAFDKAEGENPINGGKWKWYLVPAGTEIGLFNTMNKAVASSRLQYWGCVNETVNGKASSAICGRSGLLKLGASSYTALMATPALDNLKSTATVELSFDQALYDSDPKTAAVYVINSSSHSGQAGGYEVTPAIDALDPVEEFTLFAGRTMQHETITLHNVAPGARVAIGPIRKDGTKPGANQHRMYLDNVIIKVVKYETSKISLDKPVIASVEPTHELAVVKWNEVAKANSYVLEYKKSSDSKYQEVKLGRVTSYTIKSLEQNTSYDLRIKATESVSASESEYSDVKTFSTLKKSAFPLKASTADEFISILKLGDELTTAAAEDEIQITADLDFSGKTLPSAPKFTGTLNGGNHTLRNISSDHSLFAGICSAKNLTIDSSCSFATTSGGNFAALSMTADGGAISYVVNKAPVTMTLSATPSVANVLGGIVAISRSSMDNCSNLGAVKLNATVGVTSTLIGGIAGYCSKTMKSCTNSGEVDFNAPCIASCADIAGISDIGADIAGIAGYAASGSSIESCANSAKVSYVISALEQTGPSSFSNNRPRVGGIVGMSYADIVSSNNSGAIKAHVLTSDKSICKSTNYPINVGGISGGASSNSDGASCSSISDCENLGDIDYITYCDGAIPTCGGIVGYPGYENKAQTNLITRCTNRGKITCFAQDEARIGGINGGISNVTYCKNYGEVYGTIPIEDACIGGISGFHSQGLKFEYNESYGDLSNINDGVKVVEIGGLMGQHGNVNSYAGEGKGCKVNCNIKYDWGNHKWYGLIIGWNYGTSAVITMGTEDEPIKVLGGSVSCDGGKTVVSITAENYETYLKGAGSEVYTVNAKFGE